MSKLTAAQKEAKEKLGILDDCLRDVIFLEMEEKGLFATTDGDSMSQLESLEAACNDDCLIHLFNLRVELRERIAQL